MRPSPRTVLVIGAQAAGKSSVARALAGRLERAAVVDGDVLWKMVVAGGSDMSSDPDERARRQLELRYRQGAVLCDSFVRAGYVAVHAENMYGPEVERHLRSLECAASLVVLRPRPEVIEQRERARGTDAYAGWATGGTLREAIDKFDGWVAATPRLGFWIDSSDLSVDETVDVVLDRWDEAAVSW